MTSSPVNDPETLRRILGQAEALVLDFDGPICDVFAGVPAQVVVEQLCVVLADGGYGDPPPEIAKSTDPFDVLKYAAALGETEGHHVNAALTAHEVEAVAIAKPTPGAHDLMRAWLGTGRPLAIVSNNSRPAVETYLDFQGIRAYVTHVSARAVADPAKLKPSPYLINEALAALGVQARNVAFVGDSATDIEAARTVDMISIAYANKRDKVELFYQLKPAAIVDRLNVLVHAVAGPSS